MTRTSQEFLSGSLGPLPHLHGAPKGAELAALKRLSLEGLRSAITQAPGAFAIGLHLGDGRSVLAVDRFAIHSACYRVTANGIEFAERADALASRDAPVDAQAIFDYLYFHAIPSPRTIFTGVFRLPPGHIAVFDKGSLSVTPYWVPLFAPSSGPVSFDELRLEFRDLLKDAVSSQLDGGRIACFLSGGTDSSTVAGMASQLKLGPVSAFSIGFEAEGYDEMAFARIAAKHFGVEHHEYYVTPDDLVQTIPTVAVHYDQPFGNSSAVPAFHCARMAHDAGITRILAGDGGDELFGGNTRYAKQRVFGVFDDLPQALRNTLSAASALPGLSQLPLLRKGASYVQQARVPLPDRLQTYNLLARLGVAQVLSPAFLRQVNVLGPQEQQRDVWQQPKGAGRLDRQLAFDWRYTLAENDLPKVCGTTQLARLEVGFPMLDRRLVDFSLKLPTDYKLRGMKLRWFFKEALRGFLPDEIITKKKQGFGLPFGVWAVKNARLNALASDTLGSLSTRGIVQPDFIQSLLRERLPEHPGYYGEMVWILIMLEQWLQRHAPGLRLQD